MQKIDAFTSLPVYNHKTNNMIN